MGLTTFVALKHYCYSILIFKKFRFLAFSPRRCKREFFMTPTFKFPALLLSVRKANYLNRWVVFCLDSILSLLASIFALSVLNFIFNTAVNSRLLLWFVGGSFVASSVGFLLLKTYKNVIRHSTFTEVSRIAFSSLFYLQDNIYSLPLPPN